MTSWLQSLWETTEGLSRLILVAKWVVVVSGALTLVGAVVLIYADKRKGDLDEKTRREAEANFDQQQQEQREKISELSQQLSEFQRLQEEAQKKLSDVEAKQAWRNLSQAQIEILRDAFAPFQGQRLIVVTFGPDLETKTYAKQFLSIFAETGWVVEKHELLATNEIPTGLKVVIRDPNQVPPAAAALITAFRRAQIPARGVNNPKVVESVTEVRLEIGAKPK